MTNHPKDRHVVAAAIHCGADSIITLNLRHFPVEALRPWDVEAHSPDDFLIHQYHLDRETVTEKLVQQSERHGGLTRLLEIHDKTGPRFAALMRERILK